MTMRRLFQRTSRRGSVLIIVLWVCLGLVALTLYFANAMSAELRAADNRVAEVEARQALEGGIRYAAHVLANYGTGGTVPDIQNFKAEALPVGEGVFWFIGRNVNESSPTEPTFGLIDESSKLNLNTARRTMLEALPLTTMTPDISDAIYSWAHASAANSGNADNQYTQLNPPRHVKGGAFETVEELRLVYGITPALLFGEDTNRNGVLDQNENDGEQTAPRDNSDGRLDPGLIEYTTVYSRLPARGASGQTRVNVGVALTPQVIQQVRSRLSSRGITDPRLSQIAGRLQTRLNQQFRSVAEFLVVSQMTNDEFDLVHTEFTVSQNSTEQGLVNVNTASEAVLACIPGIGTENAATIVAYRNAHTADQLKSFAWLRDVISTSALNAAGPYITDQSYQFSADIAAVGHDGRGYCRERVVFDVSTGTPRIVYRQDLTAAGWALGASARTTPGSNTF